MKVDVNEVKLESYPWDIEEIPTPKTCKHMGPFCASCGNSDLFLEERLTCDHDGRTGVVIAEFTCNECDVSNIHFMYGEGRAVSMDRLAFLIGHEEEETLIERGDGDADLVPDLLRATGVPSEFHDVPLDEWNEADDSGEVDEKAVRIVKTVGNADYTADAGEEEEPEEEWCVFLTEDDL